MKQIDVLLGLALSIGAILFLAASFGVVLHVLSGAEIHRLAFVSLILFFALRWLANVKEYIAPEVQTKEEISRSSAMNAFLITPFMGLCMFVVFQNLAW